MKKQNNNFKRFGMLFAGFISLVFSYLLWEDILDLEKIFAIMFFFAGLTKVLWSILYK